MEPDNRNHSQKIKFWNWICGTTDLAQRPVFRSRYWFISIGIFSKGKKYPQISSGIVLHHVMLCLPETNWFKGLYCGMCRCVIQFSYLFSEGYYWITNNYPYESWIGFESADLPLSCIPSGIVFLHCWVEQERSHCTIIISIVIGVNWKLKTSWLVWECSNATGSRQNIKDSSLKIWDFNWN